MNIYYNPSVPPWRANFFDDPPATASTPIIDVTSVDNGAFIVMARSPSALLKHINITIDTIVTVFNFLEWM